MGWNDVGGIQHLLKDKEDINENIVQNHHSSQQNHQSMIWDCNHLDCVMKMYILQLLLTSSNQEILYKTYCKIRYIFLKM